MGALDIPTVRELEDFVITECFYNGSVKGKLDHLRNSLQASRCTVCLKMIENTRSPCA